MNILVPTILKFFPRWNEYIHTEDDGEFFCEERNVIRVDTELLDDLGEYKIRRGYPTILLHKYLDSRHRNTVLHHEIGHYILHPATAAKYSDEVLKRKIEKEANFVAAVALIPRYIIETKTLAEIAEEFNYPHKLILFRKWIFDEHKI